jgi:hypothetical protein
MVGLMFASSESLEAFEFVTQPALDQVHGGGGTAGRVQVQAVFNLQAHTQGAHDVIE